MAKKWIQKAVKKMKAKGTVGSLTAAAKRAGAMTEKGTIKKSFLIPKKSDSPAMKKKKNFARNVSKKEGGGELGAAIGSNIGNLSNLAVPGLGEILGPLLGMAGGAIGGKIDEKEGVTKDIESLKALNMTGINPYEQEEPAIEYYMSGGKLKTRYAKGGNIWKDYTGTEGKKNLQRKLQSLGYDVGPVDGILGKKTGKAVEAFQRDVNAGKYGDLGKLKADQIAGVNTLTALNAAYPASTTPSGITPGMEAEPMETTTTEGNTGTLSSLLAATIPGEAVPMEETRTGTDIPESPTPQVGAEHWASMEGGEFKQPYEGRPYIGGAPYLFQALAGPVGEAAGATTKIPAVSKALTNSKWLKDRYLQKLRNMFKGKDAKNLEGFIDDMVNSAKPVKKNIKQMIEKSRKEGLTGNIKQRVEAMRRASGGIQEMGGIIGNEDAFMFSGFDHANGGILVNTDGIPYSGGKDEVEGGEFAVKIGGDTHVFSKKLKI